MAKTQTTITSKEELDAWLEGKPRQWAQFIASRAALRVLPLIGLVQPSKEFPLDEIRNLQSVTFRASLISGGAATYPTPDIKTAAYAAYAAARAAAGAAYAAAGAAYAAARTAARAAAGAAYAAYASDAAAYAADAAARAAFAAARAADAADAAVWNSIETDAQWLEKTSSDESPLPGISFLPLWPNAAENPFATNWQQLRKSLETESAESWQPWLNWYEAVLAGKRVYADLSAEQEEALLVEWATIDPKVWEQGTEHVNRLIGEIHDKYLSQKSREVAEVTEGEADEPSDEPTNTPPLSSHVAMQDDSVNADVDHLGRSDIALALAGRLSEIWQTKNPATKALPWTQYLFSLVIWWRRLFGPADADHLQPGHVVHLDAPWGGGKTSFAGFVERILNPWRIDGEQPEWLTDLNLKDETTWRRDFHRPWFIVKFNAWQHQHVKPPWWAFYQTIRKQCLTAMRDETNHRPTNEMPEPVEPFSYRQLVGRWLQWGWCSASELLWRLMTPKFLLSLGITIVSIIALYFLISYNIVSVKDGKVGNGATGGTWLSTTLILLLGGAAPLLTIFTGLSSTLLPGTPDAANNYSMGAGDPLERFRKHFGRMMERFKRPVLVIVDDLDRCNPDFVVELVRGMQTILVSPRVVFILLGDRDWIEKSFAEVHKAMKGIDVGPEHEFGARFVEKAIQFSFVLPEINEADRRGYIRAILKIKAEDEEPETLQLPPDTSKAVQEIQFQMDEVIAQEDFETRETQADVIFKSDAYLNLPEDQQQKLAVESNVKLARRSVSDATMESGTGHMIEALAPVLPPNPRQIKRILNSLSLLQQTMRLDNPDRRPGSHDWQVLVRWVILMTEWPKTWYTLTHHPHLIDMVYDLRKSADIDLPPDIAKKLAEKIRAEQTVMDILDFENEAKGWPKRQINSATVQWLAQLMPATSGEPLTVEKKKADDEKKEKA